MIVPITLGWQRGATVPTAKDETRIQGAGNLSGGSETLYIAQLLGLWAPTKPVS
jgi:hypothetical protein